MESRFDLDDLLQGYSAGNRNRVRHAADDRGRAAGGSATLSNRAPLLLVATVRRRASGEALQQVGQASSSDGVGELAPRPIPSPRARDP